MLPRLKLSMISKVPDNICYLVYLVCSVVRKNSVLLVFAVLYKELRYKI